MSRLTHILMNAVPRMVLASPAHHLMSGRYATLHFTGRRSGRNYHVPVAYRADTDTDGIVVSTDSAWWRNIGDGEAFTVTLRGRHRGATAQRLDRDASVDALRDLVTIPGYAKAADIPRIDGNVTDEALQQAADDRVVLTLTIEDPV